MKTEPQKNGRKALFLDRDGVLCPELGRYRLAADGFELLPGASELVRAGKEKGYAVVVVTNQPQVGKGMLSEAELAGFHKTMVELLGAEPDAIYYCPHVDADDCDCRKPKPGMLVRAANEFGIDYAQSIMVGDGDKDILAGQAVGCRTIFIKNEWKTKYLKNCSPDHVVEGPGDIVALI